MEFIVEHEGKFYNTYTGEEVTDFPLKRKLKLVRRDDGIAYMEYEMAPHFERTPQIEWLEKKYNIEIFEHLRNNYYLYDTERSGGGVCLTIYECRLNIGRKADWIPVYTALAVPGEPLQEEGENSISFWRNMMCPIYGFQTIKAQRFEKRPGTMQRVREVFTCDLADNAMDFFLKFSTLKKYTTVWYPPEMFSGIPHPTMNRMIGKIYDTRDDEIIHYAWQKEIEINGIPFLDVVVLSGPVHRGVIEIREHHRFFLTEDFVYSPDGGDFGIFAKKNFYGKVVLTHFARHPNSLMLEQYHGRNMYKYIYAKYFVPAFEVTAKAGLTELADRILELFYDEYYAETDHSWTVNYFGRNDREIFGFRLKHLKQLPEQLISEYMERRGLRQLISAVKQIVGINPALLKEIADVDLLEFVLWKPDMPHAFDRLRYLRSIGTENYRDYIDYLRMCERAGRYVDGQGQYPNNLKLAHDAMVAYTRELREAKNNQDFEKVVAEEDYTRYIYIPEDRKYCILAPRTTDDLIRESRKLSHCVRAYIGDVARRYTRIYFLRLQNSKSSPLVTVEVKNSAIIQARGRFNRRLTDEEFSFLRKWANRFCLKVEVTN